MQWILLVDEDLTARDTIVSTLDHAGYFTVATASSRAAHRVLTASDERPSLALVAMAGLDREGWDALAVLKACRDAQVPIVPVIEAGQAKIVRGLRTLDKPIEPERVLAAVRVYATHATGPVSPRVRGSDRP